MSSLNNIHCLTTSKQPTDDCRAIFHKYCCYTKNWSIITNLAPRNLWGPYNWYDKMSQCGYMKHGLKDLVFCFMLKHVVSRTVGYNFPLVPNKPPGVPTFVKLVYCGSFCSHWNRKVEDYVTFGFTIGSHSDSLRWSNWWTSCHSDCLSFSLSVGL